MSSKNVDNPDSNPALVMNGPNQYVTSGPDVWTRAHQATPRPLARLRSGRISGLIGAKVSKTILTCEEAKQLISYGESLML